MNRYTIATAAFTGLLCGLWGGFAGDFGFSAWAGFAGCTAYFAVGERLLRGVWLTLVAAFVGVGMAWLMIQGAAGLGGESWAYAVSVGVLVMAIVLLGQFSWTVFIPGMFVGCYSLFAIEENNVPVLLASLTAGVILGLLCDWGGSTLFARWRPAEAAPAAAPAVGEG